MIATEYATLARVTLKELPFASHLVHMALGVAGEVGEIIDAVKKVLIYGKAPDTINFKEEVGDITWYIACLLKELAVDPLVMQRFLDRGVVAGKTIQAKIAAEAPSSMELGRVVLHINKEVAELAFDLAQLSEEGVATSVAIGFIERLSNFTGVIAGLVDVDVSQAMERNIEKLKERYGDKFSAHAALNRDLGAERRVLEGGAASDDAGGVVQ